YDSDEAALIRVARRDHQVAIQVPASFAAEASGHFAETFQAWTVAYPANDLAAVLPYLEKSLELSRRYAEFFPNREHVADPLIAQDDYGMTVSTLRPLLARLRERLVPLVRTITAQPPADASCLRVHYPADRQWELSLEVLRLMGYDFERGRQDIAPHPFTTSFSVGDVRITNRVREHDLGEAIFGALHEGGHALYEQGLQPNLEGSPLARGTSAGAHESQSRLWENLVGRSREFWTFFYPRLQSAFPEQLGQVSLDTYHRAINRVRLSLIRTEADEVTYDLHVMLRFDLELEMLEGRLAVRDLSEAWRARFKADLGIEPADDRDGVLQDVHWFWGFVGGSFQGYTLGNIMGPQFYQAALRAHPQIPVELERGELGTLRCWLRENVYSHGRKFTAAELVERVTGAPMSIEPYLDYLYRKFGELYSL
ncbi:MAG TPA: carboxypeptidase M32, partial [Anaerolineae bacterium]|nr:carboxypeptidase M32 [Anaerolineae bacterium]